MERDNSDKKVIESQKVRLEKAVSNLIEDVYKSHFKKMQKEMHLCAADCCSNEAGNIDSVQNCIESCTAPLLKAQDYLQQELGQFQQRLQKCIMECNNDCNKPNGQQHSHYEACMSKCVDKHICQLPKLLKSIQSVLSKGPPLNKCYKSADCN